MILFVCVGVMYSGEYDVCDVTLSVHSLSGLKVYVYTHLDYVRPKYTSKLINFFLININDVITNTVEIHNIDKSCNSCQHANTSIFSFPTKMLKFIAKN